MFRSLIGSSAGSGKKSSRRRRGDKHAKDDDGGDDDDEQRRWQRQQYFAAAAAAGYGPGEYGDFPGGVPEEDPLQGEEYEVAPGTPGHDQFQGAPRAAWGGDDAGGSARPARAAQPSPRPDYGPQDDPPSSARTAPEEYGPQQEPKSHKSRHTKHRPARSKRHEETRHDGEDPASVADDIERFHLGDPSHYITTSYETGSYQQFHETGADSYPDEQLQEDAPQYVESLATASAKGKSKAEKSKRTRRDAEDMADSYTQDQYGQHDSVREGASFEGDGDTYEGEEGDHLESPEQPTSSYKGKGKVKADKPKLDRGDHGSSSRDKRKHNRGDEDGDYDYGEPAHEDVGPWASYDYEQQNLATEALPDEEEGGYDDHRDDVSEPGDVEAATPDERVLTRWDVTLNLRESPGSRKPRWKPALGFLDSGNRVGPLIYKKTVLDLGFRHKDIDFDDMVEFRTLGGPAKTLGRVTLDYQIVSTGGIENEDPEPSRNRFHILETSLDDYDVFLQPDNEHIARDASTSLFAAASMMPKRKLNKEEKKRQKESFLKAEREADRQKQKKKDREEKERRREPPAESSSKRHGSGYGR